jgi:hypothetical protein
MECRHYGSRALLNVVVQVHIAPKPRLTCLWASFACEDDIDALTIWNRRIVFTSRVSPDGSQTLSVTEIPTYSGVGANIMDLEARRWVLPSNVSFS